MKRIGILGSTGSIGRQTLETVKSIGGFEVAVISANSSLELLKKQITEFSPKVVAVTNEREAAKLKKELCGKVKVLAGQEGLIEAATYEGIDTVVNAVVGNVGLIPTIHAIRAKKNICLANKETLVTAGKIIMNECEKHKVNLLPVDSEHSAIFQCLQGNDGNAVEKIYLTASGGPFLNKTKEELEKVTPKDALSHPNWSMGKKITIDSATLMNKGLEVIEAKWLFSLPLEKINVLVHPQSIIHSMVEYEDGAVMAQLGLPDMRVPIQYALTYPERVKNDLKKINFLDIRQLTFDSPDTSRFPCLDLAFQAIKTGGTMPAVLNAANEIAVARFLRKDIGFMQIPVLIERVMGAYTVKNDYTIDDVLEADSWAREKAMKIL